MTKKTSWRFFRWGKQIRKSGMRQGIAALIITLCIHFFWRQWAGVWSYFPLETFMTGQLFPAISRYLCCHVSIVFQTLIPGRFIWLDHTFFFPDGEKIILSSGCLGLKQLAHLLGLMVISGGRFFGKLMYGLGAVLMLNAVNVFRIVALGLVLLYQPHWWLFFHDFFFRFIFYVVIFLLWIIREEDFLEY